MASVALKTKLRHHSMHCMHDHDCHDWKVNNFSNASIVAASHAGMKRR